MRPSLLWLLPLLTASLPAFAQDALVRGSPGDRWPGFRGVGTGHSLAARFPLRWSEGENVAWSVVPPGFGQSSPVVWKERVFVTSVEGTNKERCILTAYRLNDGAQLWSRSFAATVEIESTEMVSRGAPTPAVDAERVYAFFESGDLFAFDHEGQLLWRRGLASEYGPFEGNHGIASSVVATDDALLLLADHEGPSYLLKIDKKSGNNVWKVQREPRASWSTPVVAGAELIVSSNGSLEGLDLADGRVRWSLDGLRGNSVPSPTVVGERVMVGSSDGGGNLLARRGSPGRAAEVLWRPSKARPSGFASPLVAGGRVYLVNKSGTLSCLSLAGGELLWDLRLPESCWASPIAAGDLVYFFGKDGTTTVLRPGDDEAELVAENRLETETRVYGVAAVDGCLLLREGTRLTCLRKVQAASNPEETSDRKTD